MSRVLITAGAAGIGRAMAEAFDAAGHQVWIVDLDRHALNAAPAHWRRDRVDVADEAAISQLFAAISADWGGVDVVCANAGIAGPTGRVQDIDLADWRSCIAVNLDGAFLTAKYASPLMRKQKSGSLILTSSTAGLYGMPFRSPYSSAKWAVIGLAKTLAMELGPDGIRVNAICPGSVEGPRMEQVLAREAEAKGVSRDHLYHGYASGTSMKTFVEARDIANMAVFLASDAARYVSGQAIAVDGHTENPDPKP